MKYLLILLVFVVGCNKKLKDIPILDDEVKVVKEIVKQPLTFNEAKFGSKNKIIPDIETKNPINEMVYFEFDSDTLTSEAKYILFSILGQLSKNEIAIKGFCCPIGSDDYNYRLGLRRANSVYKFFERNYPDLNAICVSGGEYELINNNPSEYYLNRRVEIKEAN